MTDGESGRLDSFARPGDAERSAWLAAEVRRQGFSAQGKLDVPGVRDLLRRGESLSAIGREFGVTKQAVHEFVKRHGLRRGT